MIVLLFRFAAFIGYTSVFCPQKQSVKQPTKIQVNVLLLYRKADAKIPALLKEKEFT